MNSIPSTNTGWFHRILRDYAVLIYSMPPFVLSLFFVSVIMMNFFSNKEWFSTQYCAFDCGYSVSWISFLCMDMICKRYGGKAAMRVSIVALLLNFCFALLLFLLSRAPGHWNVYYDFMSSPEIARTVDSSINTMIGGTWYVVFGSALAMFVSSFVNGVANNFVARHLKKDNYVNFAIRSFSSTMLAQIVDNLIFASVVGHIFFGWTYVQVMVCSLAAAVLELLFEMLFSPLGYAICRKWDEMGIGKAYLDHINNKPLNW